LGILIQLPLPEWLQPYQQVLCDEIDSTKDIDAMTTQMMGKIATGKGGTVYPAAVAATIELLKYYEIDNLRGKQVSILGQSNLIGKPMALYCIYQ
jgi:methylenetetrahydrofolate dehydrogenase (NADP+)/methenyltetrahydrofolate cyclohydrolase